MVELRRIRGLLRNSCYSILLWSELEAKNSGLFVEATNEVALIFSFVIALAGVAVLLAAFEHPVDDPSQLVRHDFDRLGRVEPCFQAAAEGAFAFEGRLGTEPQDVGGAVMSSAGLPGQRFSVANPAGRTEVESACKVLFAFPARHIEADLREQRLHA